MEIRAVRFRSHGRGLVGGLFLPSRPRPGPAVLLLHGFPGVQRNEDLASELCRRGIAAFMPHYRGCWGSEGEFSLEGALEDSHAALSLLERYRFTDPARLGLLGYSMGGWLGMQLAAERRLAGAALLAPAFPRLGFPQDRDYLRKQGRVLRHAGASRVWAEYVAAASFERSDGCLDNPLGTPLLFVSGTADRLVPAAAVRRLYGAAGGPKDLLELPGEGHEFQLDRPRMVSALCGWLAGRLGPRAEALPGRGRAGLGGPAGAAR